MGISRGLLNSIFGGVAGAGQFAGQRRAQNLEHQRFQADDAWRREEPARQEAMARKQLEIRADFENRERQAEEARNAKRLAGDRQVWRTVLSKMPGARPEDIDAGSVDRDAFYSTYERLRTPKVVPTKGLQAVERGGQSFTFDPERGTYAAAKDLTGQSLPADPVKADRGTLPTETERRASALYQVAQSGYDALEGLLGSGKGVPSWRDQQLAKLGMGAGNIMTGDEYRQFQQAALQLSDSWLRYTSGAAVPESEVHRFALTFTPLAGDDQATLQQKSRARKTLLEALRSGAGRAVPDSSRYSLDNPYRR